MVEMLVFHFEVLPLFPYLLQFELSTMQKNHLINTRQNSKVNFCNLHLIILWEIWIVYVCGSLREFYDSCGLKDFRCSSRRTHHPCFQLYKPDVELKPEPLCKNKMGRKYFYRLLFLQANKYLDLGHAVSVAQFLVVLVLQLVMSPKLPLLASDSTSIA